MRYEMMRPSQIHQAIIEKWPVVLPLGVLEYHGEHLPVGMDTLAVARVVELLEKEMPLVMLPPFYYGAASYVVAPPEGKGTVHVDSGELLPFAKGLFRSLLRIGFRNIHFFIHHQAGDFRAGMPTDLAFRLAARQAIFDFLEKERGEGWWGDNKMAGNCSPQGSGEDPFDWIQGHPLMAPETAKGFPLDHAGEGETSLMMALCPDTVEMKLHVPGAWYARSAMSASKELGDAGVRTILETMRRALRKSTS